MKRIMLRAILQFLKIAEFVCSVDKCQPEIFLTTPLIIDLM